MTTAISKTMPPTTPITTALSTPDTHQMTMMATDTDSMESTSVKESAKVLSVKTSTQSDASMALAKSTTTVETVTTAVVTTVITEHRFD